MQNKRNEYANRAIVFILVMLAAFLFLLLVFGVTYLPEPTFHYRGYVKPAPVCEGGALTVEIFGDTLGLPNVTHLYHTSYFSGTSIIAKRHEPLPAVTGARVEPQDFRFTAVVNMAGLSAGDYYYVRTAEQEVPTGTFGRTSTNLTQIQVHFEVVNCDN